MNDSKKDLESDRPTEPSSQRCQAGTLLHYFQKVIPARQPEPNKKCGGGITNYPGSTTDQRTEESSLSPVGSKRSKSLESVQHKAKAYEDKRADCGMKFQQLSSVKQNVLVDLTDEPQNTDGATRKANQDVNKEKSNTSSDESSGRSTSSKKLPLNPFQVLMDSGKKKGIWNKPTSQIKESEDVSPEDVCLTERIEPVVSTGQSGNAKFFAIFSKQIDKDMVHKGLSDGEEGNKHDPLCRASSSEKKTKANTKNAKLDKTAELSKTHHSSSRKDKQLKASDKSSSDTVQVPKKKKLPSGMTHEERERTGTKEQTDCTSPEGKKAQSSSHSTKRAMHNSDKPSLHSHQKNGAPSNPRKSRSKVVDDSDFEPDDVRSGKRKDRTPSKSQRGDNKRRRTNSHSRGDADSSTKPAALSAAQKLVRKSRDHKRRSAEGMKRDGGQSDKPKKQSLLWAERTDSAAPPADTGSGAGDTPRRSARSSRRPLPSDSEMEFTPAKKSRSRRAEPSQSQESKCTPGKKPGRRSSRCKQPADPSGSELEATPVKKPGRLASVSGRQRQLSGSDVEVLSTKKATRRPGRPSGRAKNLSGDVVEVTPEKKPERRSSRPRRPVVFSDSEVEVSPIKKPSRRCRAAHTAARPATPTDSELEVTPVKKPARRSGRARRVRQLSDSEVELSPRKKPAARGGGRRAGGDEPEVLLVRSRSAGSAGAKPGGRGVDAFQMMQRGGRPAKETAEQKAATAARRAFLSSGVPESLQLQAEVARRLEESLTPLFPEISHVHQRGAEPGRLTEDRPLPGGLLWRAESEPPPVCPAAVRDLLPVRVSQPIPVVKPAASQLDVVTAGGDNNAKAPSGADDGSAGKVKPYATDYEPSANTVDSTATSGTVPSDGAAARDPPSPPRLPCLSLPECTPSLRRLLSAEREAAPGPGGDCPVSSPALWTDRFRPRKHAAFVGDSLPAEQLQTWLADWTAPGASGWDDDGSDEAAVDGTVLLLGPTGCGKTSAVYAAAAQLGFQVLEVSASSRRSGRHLSSQLSEATQSQRVNVPGGAASAGEPARSLLLLEDVQLASDEQDDGFLAAAASLAAAAKRPVVLTSSDPAVTRTRLLRALPHRLLRAAAPPAAALGRELALVALTQGWLLPERAAASLAAEGDVRRALLQLQWLCEGAGGGDGTERVDTRRALTEAQLEEVEEFVGVLPEELRVVRLEGGAELSEALTLEKTAVGRRQSGWRPPVREAAAGYDGQTRRRWRVVDPDLFSDEDEASPAPAPAPAPVPAPVTEEPSSAAPEPHPPEERSLLASSVATLADFYDLQSACDALVAPAERGVMCSWWQRRPEADMTEIEQPRCVTEERGHQLGHQLATETLGTASRRCGAKLRAARAEFAACRRPEPAVMWLPQYDEDGVKETAWAESSCLAPVVPGLLLSRRVVAADLLPSIRRMCRLECGRRARDGGRTRRFLHYFDQMGLHAVPSDLRADICTSLM